MKGTIIHNAFYRSEGVNHQIESLTQAFSKLGVSVSVMNNGQLPVHLTEEGIQSAVGETDFIIYLDKDIHIAYMLEKAGYRLFNSARAIELCDDKMQTYIALSGVVRIPKTVSSPLMYRAPKEDSFLDRVCATISFPMVVKEAFGSLGAQVYLANDRKELSTLRENLKYKRHIYQELVSSSYGKDVRVIVVGGRAIAAMLRKSETDFRSNIELGGVGEAIDPPRAFLEAAEKAAKELNLTYCGVDLLFGEDGNPVLCEVNSNAFFKTAQKFTSVNIAEEYAKEIIRKLSE